MSGPTWSVLVVGYNSPDEIRLLLQDVAALPHPEEREVLIAENGEAELPGMRELSREFEATLLELPNPGFGAACNALAAAARGRNLLLANPDLRIPRDVLPALAERLADPAVGSVGPLLRDEDGAEQISWNLPMGLRWEFLEAHGLQTIWRRRMVEAARRRNPSGPWEVGFSTAACLALRAETFRGIGGFDERFFLNYEDIELGDRLRAAGLRNLVDPALSAVHGNSKVQGRDLGRFVFHRLQAKWIYLGIRYRGIRRVLARILWFEQAALRLCAGSVCLKGSERTRLPGYARALGFALGRGGGDRC